MKKTLIIECTPRSENPIDAHVRNSLHLQNHLRCALYFDGDDVRKFCSGDFQHICISYGSFYTDFVAIEKILDANPKAKLWWMTNEYSIGPNGNLYRQLKDRNYSVIANCESESSFVTGWKEWHTFNLNLLFAEMPCARAIVRGAPLIYYGTFRPDRSLYFKQYFDERIIVSTSSKNAKKFKEVCRRSPHLIKKLNWQKGRESLACFKFSLYIEDVWTHTHYNHPANRFYEALAYRSLMLIDKNCAFTFRRAGIDVPDEMFVGSRTELWRRIDSMSENRREILLDTYQKKWAESAIAARAQLLERISLLFS